MESLEKQLEDADHRIRPAALVVMVGELTEWKRKVLEPGEGDRRIRALLRAWKQ